MLMIFRLMVVMGIGVATAVAEELVVVLPYTTQLTSLQGHFNHEVGMVFVNMEQLVRHSLHGERMKASHWEHSK